MRRIFKIICLSMLLFSFNSAKAQTNDPVIFLNHLYFVLDSITYAHIFESPSLQQIADTSEKSVTTTNDTWHGKYFTGRNSYFEIFPPNGFSGATEGSIGLGFMTFKPGDLNKLEINWKKTSKDSLIKDTSTVVKDGKKILWYYSLLLYPPDSLQQIYAWIMENTPEILKATGFTDEEIKNPISWQDFYEKKSKIKFTKEFNSITSVTIITNKNEFKYLKKSFLDFGLTEKSNTFSNDYISITCNITDITASRLKTVEISLSNAVKEENIVVSKMLSIQLKGKKAVLTFVY